VDCLQGGSGVSDCVSEPCVPGTKAIGREILVVVDNRRMFWIEHPWVFLPDEFFHHGVHVHLALIEEYLGVLLARNFGNYIPPVNMIDSIQVAEIAGYFDWIASKFARHCSRK